MTDKTIVKIIKLLRCAFKQAVRWELIGKNPFDNVVLPKTEYKKRDIWNTDTIRKALDECTDSKLYIAMNLSFACSLRLGEILGLTWDNVHIEDANIAADDAYIFIDKELVRCTKQAIEMLGEKDIYHIFIPLMPNTSTRLVLKKPKVSVAKAQHDAMEKALSDAGFGLQFIPVSPSAVKAEEKAVTKKAEKPKQSVKEVKPEKAEEPVKAEIKTEAVEAEPEAAPAKAETEEAPPVTDPLLTVVNNIESGSIKVDEQTGEVIEQQAAAEDEPTPVSYDKTTPIDEICAVMTLEDAKNYVIDGGPYNGWKVGTLAERRPVKVLEMIIEKYPTEDNILRAATKLILDSMK